MKINIPEQAVKIINVLEQAGFEAYVVGGCVRDSLKKRAKGLGYYHIREAGAGKSFIFKNHRYRNRTWNRYGNDG